MMDDHQDLPESRCLGCGKQLDCAMGEERRPEPGDITLCIRCGHVMAFGDDLHLRELTGAEMVEVAGDEKLVAYSNVLKEAKAEYERETGKPWCEEREAMSGMVRGTGIGVDDDVAELRRERDRWRAEAERAYGEALAAAAALIESRANAFPTPGEEGATARTEWMNGFLIGLAEAVRELKAAERSR